MIIKWLRTNLAYRYKRDFVKYIKKKVFFIILFNTDDEESHKIVQFKRKPKKCFNRNSGAIKRQKESKSNSRTEMILLEIQRHQKGETQTNLGNQTLKK
jgi:hypothetical protein